MTKPYTLKQRTIAARPRAKRLRELGGTTTSNTQPTVLGLIKAEPTTPDTTTLNLEAFYLGRVALSGGTLRFEGPTELWLSNVTDHAYTFPDPELNLPANFGLQYIYYELQNDRTDNCDGILRAAILSDWRPQTGRYLLGVVRRTEGILRFNCMHQDTQLWSKSLVLPDTVAPLVPHTPLPSNCGRLRILFLGNSFIEQPLCHLGLELLDTWGFTDDDIQLTAMYRGGASLQGYARGWSEPFAARIDYVFQDPGLPWAKHVGGVNRGYLFSMEQSYTDIPAQVCAEGWDVICIQQQSTLSGQLPSVIEGLRTLLPLVLSTCTNPSVHIMYHATWATINDDAMAVYGSNDAMHQAIADVAGRLPALTGIQSVIPSYQVVHAERERLVSLGQDPDAVLLSSDGLHLTDAGNRLVAQHLGTWLLRMMGWHIH